ncbi:MAG: DUF429 domain-containing protein [Variovorax sp.]|nr:MAG: DUF429 domain-containing protein [Variovorax sp.]
MGTLLLGCDFSSAPTARKPIVVATGELASDVVRLSGFQYFDSLEAWGRWLAEAPAWVGGFDFPFGLPRELVVRLGWPLHWDALIAHYIQLDRAAIREHFVAFCAARPVGGKFAHRATDGPAGSSPSMKWVNPPVAYMLHAGVPRLLAAGAALPGLHRPATSAASAAVAATAKGAERVALEAYPGLLARELIGRRSYKSDERQKQTPDRAAARALLLAALEQGTSRLGLRLGLEAAQRMELQHDAQGDRIDAVLCLIQAAWGFQRSASPGPGYGLPRDIDPLEGWIVTA